jgi:hypothetical protein
VIKKKATMAMRAIPPAAAPIPTPILAPLLIPTAGGGSLELASLAPDVVPVVLAEELLVPAAGVDIGVG